MPPTAPLPTETVNTVPSMLETFCGAIRDYEGKPGDLNYMLNNPGDVRPSPVGYLPMYEPVVIVDTDTSTIYPFHKGKFAKFPTYEIGWEYLMNLVHYTATIHPDWTILDYFSHYAPTSDGNAPLPYADYVATACGCTVDNSLQFLLG